MNFYIKVLQKRKLVWKLGTHKRNRFTKKTGTINWKICPIKVYLKVTYGKFRDHHGIPTVFYNDGLYDVKDDFYRALTAFMEG